MKNIFGIILILACFSCNSSPISGTNEIYDTYLPSNSEAYDLQRNSLDVLHSYVNNNSAKLARSSSGFYAGLLDTMSSWVSTQTNIDKDHINEVLSTTKNNTWSTESSAHTVSIASIKLLFLLNIISGSVVSKTDTRNIKSAIGYFFESILSNCASEKSETSDLARNNLEA